MNYQCDVVVLNSDFEEVIKKYEFSADDEDKAVKLVVSLVDSITKFTEMVSVSLKCRILSSRDTLPSGISKLEERLILNWNDTEPMTFCEAVEAFNEYFHAPS
jgi:hypothetical protein